MRISGQWENKNLLMEAAPLKKGQDSSEVVFSFPVTFILCSCLYTLYMLRGHVFAGIQDKCRE
jgi:hypothetical protein